jgi:hypothetical protein
LAVLIHGNAQVAPNRPAKLLGLSTSPSIASAENDSAPDKEADDVHRHFAFGQGFGD